MTQYTVLYVRRSDGRTEIATKNKTEKNQPTPDQMNRTPDAKGVSDYYREIDDDELKYLDWRRKLASMLMRELQGKEFRPNVPYILDALPENYRLFEHIKSKSTDGEKSTKTHAGGGHDRQDAYLYGHPLGRKKRFRSPADFFPHLLWLATDETGDSDNCSCKLCAPDDMQPEDKTPKNAKPPAATAKKDDGNTKPAAPKTVPVVEIPAKPNAPVDRSKAARAAAAAANRPAGWGSALLADGSLAPMPLPKPRGLDQQLDLRYNQFAFRIGETVWFLHEGGAWGLAVIVRRWLSKSQVAPNNRHYSVQPLSHPFDTRTPKTIDHEAHLRPWLAWSPPPLTHQGLNNQNITYDTANWSEMQKGTFGAGDLCIDGSILSAKAIDGTFTPLDPVQHFKQPGEREVTQWNSVYAGGERIWVGDAIRIRAGNPEDILLVGVIVEATVPDTYNGGSKKTTYTLLGDVFTPTPLPPDGTIETLQFNHLPHRMTEDLKFRNRVAAPFNTPQQYWKLTKFRQSVDIADIRGRWYESSVLGPILNGQQTFNEGIRSGRVDSVSRSLNNRGDCNGGPGRAPNTRKATRKEAFGHAVPASLELVENTIEEPAQQPYQPPPAQQQVNLYTTAPDQTNTTMTDAPQPAEGQMEEFVSYDMQGFGDAYGHQENFFQ